MNNNLFSWLSSSPKDSEREQTLALLRSLRHNQQHSPLYTDEAITKFAVDTIENACHGRWDMPGVPLGGGLFNLIKSLLHYDAIIGELPPDEDVPKYGLDEQVRIRAAFRRHERFQAGHSRLLPLWQRKVTTCIQAMLSYFPESAFIEVDENGIAEDDSIVFPQAHAYDLCDNLPEVIQRLITTFLDTDIAEAGLFQTLREALENNLARASGYDPYDRNLRNPRIIFPTQSRLTEPSALIHAYLQGTPFEEFFYRRLPFAIPFPARFEHTHVVGGTGHGKTQLLQFLIHHDLMRARDDGRSVVILDSQGDLIRTIAHLDVFSHSSMRERFVLVDPNDVEHPVCLNMFDFNRDRLSGYAPVDREKILNATIELYEYFFGALLGAELTQRQGLIFRYLARLLIEIPNATIHTLRELMEDGEKFRPYMAKLSGTPRSFFATQFFEPKFKETKKQILTRLWGVLSNSSLERMFSHRENKIDIFELLNQGKIILINTAKDLLGQDGAAIFGRFFIALIAQASIQRAAMKPHERRSSFVYIDEAQDYFDDNISNILTQARKYRVGLIFAHQNLDQLSGGLRASVLASTTIKLVGGVSAKDANTLDSELRCTSDFLLSQKKGKEYSEFACFIKNYTAQALSVSVPLGYVEARQQSHESDYEYLIDQNRELYTAEPEMIEETPFPEARPKWESKDPKVREPVPEPEQEIEVVQPEAPTEHIQSVPPPFTAKPVSAPKREPIPKEATQPGKGGKQHKYLQQLIKQLAEERGFRASIEETILDGAGRVDVSLVRDNLRVACQVSVTTTKDWELGGIEKCLEAGYSYVLLVGATKRHLSGLATFVEDNLDAKDQGKVHYVIAEGLIAFLDSLGAPQTAEKMVKGYKVRTTQAVTDTDDALNRRKAISEVIAKSLKAK